MNASIAMTLNPLSNHPSSRSYVLKLNRDAAPQRDRIAGRLENMVSGRHFDFHSLDELFACLAADMALTETNPEN